jgi:hypothetical protein
MAERDDDFPDPVPERLTLHDGQFVDVKRELTHGETEDLYAAIYPYGMQDRRMVRTAKIDAYLLQWSLTKKGVPVPMAPASKEFPAQARLDTIRSLSARRALEIYNAIETHEAKHEAAAAAKKKIPAGAPVAGPSSPSPSGPATDSPPAPSGT